MKRLVLSFFMSMAIWSVASTQITLLLEGGANYGKGAYSDVKALKDIGINRDAITSYYFAAIPKIALLNKLTGFAEFQYSVEGTNVSYPAGPDLKDRLHYIRFIPGLEVKLVGPLSILGGFNIGYGAVQTQRSSGTIVTVKNEFRSYKRSDYGVLAGINLNFSGFNVTAKYNYGFNDIGAVNYTDMNGVELTGGQVKSRFLQVGVGYELGL